MDSLIQNPLPLCWLLAIVVLLRWFHGIASEPQVDGRDSAMGAEDAPATAAPGPTVLSVP